MLFHTFPARGHNLVAAAPGSSPIQSLKLKSSAPASYLWSWKRPDHMLPFQVNIMTRRVVLRLDCLMEVYTYLPLQKDEETNKVLTCEKINERIGTIRSILSSMEDGETGVSPYDTAWVSLVEDADKIGVPQFPSALEWISKNQHIDGSWGDRGIFSAHDRIINTLACIVALKTWDIHPLRIQRGLKFIWEHMRKLEEEKGKHMPIAFELTFPNLLEMAKALDIEVPHDSSFIQSIYAMRNLKLTRIPMDTLHFRPTSLLFTLEGMQSLDWEKLLRFKGEEGSFLFSPSSTAFALMQTGDKNCLNYLKKVVQRFMGEVAPSVYPVDLFENIWAIDRLQRLGISRHFLTEIRDCVSYVRRYWTETGICWARNSKVKDLDDTAMAFRILRLNGYEVCSDVFHNFQNGKEFFCFVGQTNEAVTGMFNLFRASQLRFPGENILEEAREFSFRVLRDKQACGELADKWVIAKDLPGEVEYALDVPWYASLPRLEARFYIEQYGGDNDVWIAKSLYRMHNINNNTYLELAKLDYNDCQAFHRSEWDSLEMWYNTSCIVGHLGIGRRTVLMSYFLAAATIFEPERYMERLAWAKSAILIESIVAYFHLDEKSPVQYNKALFLYGFRSESQLNSVHVERRNSSDLNNVGQELMIMLVEFLREFSLNLPQAHGTDNFPYLCRAVTEKFVLHFLRWEKWMVTVGNKEEGYMYGQEGDLLVQTLNMSLTKTYKTLSCQPLYQQLSSVASKLCNQLRQSHQEVNQFSDGRKPGKGNSGLDKQIESDMQQLVMLVLQNSSSSEKMAERDIKQTYLSVARSFYYTAYCDSATVDYHLAKVLFDKVE